MLTLAVAEMLVRAGERVALLGLTPPMASRKATTRIAEALAANEGDRSAAGEPAAQGAPVAASPAPSCSAISSIRRRSSPQRINEMAEGGVQGHLIQVLDPAEETLAYEGRMEFRSPEGGERWIADRVETLRDGLPAESWPRIAPRIEEAARRIGWSFLVHHTDRPAAEPLLTLIMRLQGMAGDYRWKPRVRRRREARA